jgi:signal transduction histidine kinase
MVAFGLVSLILASTLATITYALVRTWVVDDRESAAMRQAYTNARLVRNRLRADDTDIPALLSGLQVTGTGDVLLERQGRWYTSSVRADRSVLPTSLREPVADGHAARQIVPSAEGPVLLIGVPIAEQSAELYVIESLEDVQATLRGLRSALIIGATLAAVVGAATGAVISGRILRPLRDVSTAATRIAGGEHDIRLEPSGDPDLEPLTASFNGMVDELEERTRREARFASDVSHDLRGPLTALSAAVTVVGRHREQLPEAASAAVDALDDQVDSFNQLVVDLLEISRFEAGTATLQTRNVDVVEFTRAVLDEAGAEVPIRHEPGFTARVDLDPRRMLQVLSNLVDNADRYAGGAVAVRLDRARSGTVSIAVEDRGPGVPPELATAIFNRYERGIAAQGGEMTQGTGLGLALAAEHVKLHGGSIRVEPNPGGGSRFVIELPEAI